MATASRRGSMRPPPQFDYIPCRRCSMKPPEQFDYSASRKGSMHPPQQFDYSASRRGSMHPPQQFDYSASRRGSMHPPQQFDYSASRRGSMHPPQQFDYSASRKGSMHSPQQFDYSASRKGSMDPPQEVDEGHGHFRKRQQGQQCDCTTILKYKVDKKKFPADKQRTSMQIRKRSSTQPMLAADEIERLRRVKEAQATIAAQQARIAAAKEAGKSVPLTISERQKAILVKTSAKGEQIDPFMNSAYVFGLNSDNFRQVVEGFMTVVMFYDPQKQDCIRHKDDFARVAEVSKNTCETYAAVNCGQNPELCAQEEITELPFIRFYRKGENLQDFRLFQIFNKDNFLQYTSAVKSYFAK